MKVETGNGDAIVQERLQRGLPEKDRRVQVRDRGVGCVRVATVRHQLQERSEARFESVRRSCVLLTEKVPRPFQALHLSFQNKKDFIQEI